MEQVLLTPKEAALLAAIESESEFSLSQAAIWANMGPTEIRDLLKGLAKRKLVVHSQGERFSFTKDGLYAKHQLSRGHDKKFWIYEGDDRASSGGDDSDRALGDAIDRLK